jgi:flavin reductase (DIM6/NTAB) family NADH-FMN oxidoreductase RutF
MESKRFTTVPIHAAFNLCAPRPIAVLTTRQSVDCNAAPMSTLTSMLTLQGKREAGFTGAFADSEFAVHMVSITATRKTYLNLLKIGETVANFLGPTQQNVERMYVLSDGAYWQGNAKIKASGFTLEDSFKLSVPRIAEAMAWIEYKLIRMIDIPESERPIFLLQPVAAYCVEGLVDPKTYAYCTLDVPLGQLSANICSGRLQEILVAKERTSGRALTPCEHWAYSDRGSLEEPFLNNEKEKKGGVT